MMAHATKQIVTCWGIDLRFRFWTQCLWVLTTSLPFPDSTTPRKSEVTAISTCLLMMSTSWYDHCYLIAKLVVPKLTTMQTCRRRIFDLEACTGQVAANWSILIRRKCFNYSVGTRVRVRHFSGRSLRDKIVHSFSRRHPWPVKMFESGTFLVKAIH